MDLEEVHRNCLTGIRSAMEFLSAGYSMRESGGSLEEVSLLFQGLGICHLLHSLDIDQFRENLVRSGLARRYFLLTSQAEGNVTSKHLALSRTEAFLDVLVAGDLSVARSIAELSPKKWNHNWEYEDDFCFYMFLQQLLIQALPADLEQTISRFEVSLEGGSSTRLRVLRALLARDARDFELSLSELLEEEQKRSDLRRSSIVNSKFLFWPRSFVSIEGLALLRAAELVGLSIEGGLPLCPHEARIPIRESDCRDLFSELADLLAANTGRP